MIYDDSIFIYLYLYRLNVYLIVGLTYDKDKKGKIAINKYNYVHVIAYIAKLDSMLTYICSFVS
jgi:hypothetical protein